MKKLLMILMVAVATTSVTFSQKKSSDEVKVSSQHTIHKADFSFSFDHLSLSVRDAAQSAEFYKRVLDLEEIIKTDDVIWLSLGEGKQLHLVALLKDPVKINKSVHLALTAYNFDTFVKKLDSMKIPYSDFPGAPGKINIRQDGIKQVYFQDPDGYWIEINSVADGRDNAAKTAYAAVESQIITIEKAGWEAWKNKDAKWFHRNMTEDLIQVTSDGVFTKTQVIKSLPTDCTVKSVSLDNFKFVMLSQDAALMTYTATQDGVCSGKKIPSQVRATVNYVKRNGNWLEAMYMETPVAQ